MQTIQLKHLIITLATMAVAMGRAEAQSNHDVAYMKADTAVVSAFGKHVREGLWIQVLNGNTFRYHPVMGVDLQLPVWFTRFSSRGYEHSIGARFQYSFSKRAFEPALSYSLVMPKVRLYAIGERAFADWKREAETGDRWVAGTFYALMFHRNFKIVADRYLAEVGAETRHLHVSGEAYRIIQNHDSANVDWSVFHTRKRTFGRNTVSDIDGRQRNSDQSTRGGALTVRLNFGDIRTDRDGWRLTAQMRAFCNRDLEGSMQLNGSMKVRYERLFALGQGGLGLCGRAPRFVHVALEAGSLVKHDNVNFYEYNHFFARRKSAGSGGDEFGYRGLMNIESYAPSTSRPYADIDVRAHLHKMLLSRWLGEWYTGLDTDEVYFKMHYNAEGQKLLYQVGYGFCNHVAPYWFPYVRFGFFATFINRTYTGFNFKIGADFGKLSRWWGLQYSMIDRLTGNKKRAKPYNGVAIKLAD